MKYCFTTILLIITTQVLIQAQAPDSIPFELTTYNNILIEATLNGEDTLKLMFHSAASSVATTPQANEKINKQKDLTKTSGKAWGGEGEASFSEGNSLSIGTYSWDSLRVWANSRSGHFSDGKFGPNLFDGKYIELNYDLMKMVIHKELPEMEGYSRYNMKQESGTMYLSGSCFNGKKSYENTFMIHSGYSGTILLDDTFASMSEMSRLEIIDESELKDSYGNVVKKKKATMPRFEMEEFTFLNMPVGFFEGRIRNQSQSVIGGEMLKRFNIVFDREEGHIYLKPNSLYSLPVKDV